jgi:AraC-like DNA-binding protein
VLAGAVIYVPTPDCLATLHTGPIDPRDREPMFRLFQILVSDAVAARYDLLQDLAATREIDESAYAFLERVLTVHAEPVARRTRRYGIVRPGGLAGAAFSGIFGHWIAPRFDAQLCQTRAEAYAHLELGDDAPARVAIERTHAEFAEPAIVRAVRERLASDLRQATIQRTSSALGMSARSLQRELAAYGTNFRGELVAARMRSAEARLLANRDKIATIARDLGFSSQAAFHRTFVRVVGCPPSEFRERGQRGP